MTPSDRPTSARGDEPDWHKFISELSKTEQRILSKALEDAQKQELRKHPRTPCAIITEYTIDNRAYKGTIENISPGGAFIRSRDVFPVNRQISQSFFYPNFEIPIRSNSKIVWVGSRGFGVRFDIVEVDL